MQKRINLYRSIVMKDLSERDSQAERVRANMKEETYDGVPCLSSPGNAHRHSIDWISLSMEC